MLKVFQINIFGNLSTGKIATDIYHALKDADHDGVVAFARNEIDPSVQHIRIGNLLNVYVDGVLTRLTDRAGHYSVYATKRLIKKIETYNPDIIHLHNLHGYYINVPILFEYLKKSGKPVVWTLHDCWAFTGHCCHFVAVNCDKWKSICHDCCQLKEYPASLFRDNSRQNYIEKKKMICSMDNLHIVTVSKWLEGVVRQSFLKGLPIQIERCILAKIALLSSFHTI